MDNPKETVTTEDSQEGPLNASDGANRVSGYLEERLSWLSVPEKDGWVLCQMAEEAEAERAALRKRAEQAERERDAFRTGWRESNEKWGEMVADLREAEAKAFERAETAEARVAELEAHIAEMEANRGGFTLGYVEEQQAQLKARVAELEAENQKLRVLGILDCQDCCGCLDGGAYCSDCFTRGYFTGDRKPEWRPIETAPKDGTWFLGADRYGVNEVHNTRAGWKIRGIDSKPISLTHWMPLPCLPEVQP